MARAIVRRASRPKSWVSAVSVAGLAQAANTQVAGAITNPVTFPRTLLRLRGELYVSVDGAETGGDLMQLTVGIKVIEVDLAGSILSTPFSDAEDDWLWWDTTFVGLEVSGNDAVSRTSRKIVDNKAMRRMKPDQVLAMVVESTTISVGSVVNTLFNGRALFAS